MENLLADFALRFSEAGELLGLVLALVSAGIVLILANTVTHSLQNRFSERRRHRLRVERHLEPLLDATSDLVSRIGEIIVFQRPSMMQALGMYDRGAELPKFDPQNLDRHQSTAYRLIKFFAAARSFQRNTADIPTFSLLRRVNYYLERKLPTAFKGNLYQIEGIPKEVQECIGDDLLDQKRGRVTDLGVRNFCNLVNDASFDAGLLRYALDFFAVDPLPLKRHDNIDPQSENWRHLLSITHVGIYLIDLFQDLGRNPRWEEYRVFLVALVRQWNRSASARRYLYEKDDAAPEARNYIDTYSERVAWRHAAFRIAHLVPRIELLGKLRRRLQRLARWDVVRKRGKRYVGPHPPKWAHGKGLYIGGGSVLTDLRWDDDLESLHDAVCYYLQSEGIVAEVF